MYKSSPTPIMYKTKKNPQPPKRMVIGIDSKIVRKPSVFKALPNILFTLYCYYSNLSKEAWRTTPSYKTYACKYLIFVPVADEI